jgi:hypothetical protein
MSDNPFAYPASASEHGADATWEHGASVPARADDVFACWHVFAERLARLGSVLWLYRGSREEVFPRARLLTSGALLLDHPALAAFAQVADVTAHAEVDSHGPREWLELHDADAACLARVHLLPDTDYLAWDTLIADCGIRPVASVVSRRRWGFANVANEHREWHAMVARFPLLRLPCLQLLGLRAPVALSAMSVHIAQRIAREHPARWQNAVTTSNLGDQG